MGRDGAYRDNHETGRYYCRGGNAPLFDSDTEFDRAAAGPVSSKR